MSLLCGLTLTVFNFAKLMLLDRLPLQVALIVCTALFCAILVSKMIGCALPMLAKKIGFDPTLVSTPIVTTIVDVVSILIYVLIATAVL